MHQLTQDVAFLSGNNIMDQSFLLGVHKGEGKEHVNQEAPAAKNMTSENEVDDHDITFEHVSKHSLKGPLLQVKPDREDLFSVFQREHGGIRGVLDKHPDEGLPVVYIFGIIDILQEFNTRKQIEANYKAVRYNTEAVSAVNSKLYSTRFLEYLESKII